MAGEILRGPARGADQIRHPPQRLRILLQQREISAASADCFEQIQPAGQRIVRPCGAGGGFDDAWHQRIEAAADVRGQLAIAVAALQGGEAIGERAWVVIAELDQHLFGGGLVLGASPYIIKGVVFVARVAEHGIEVAADVRAVLIELAQQRGAVRQCHCVSDAFQFVWLLW